jgi:hypothetical protein
VSGGRSHGGGWGANLVRATPAALGCVLFVTFSGCFLDAEGITEGPPPCNTKDDCPDPGPCAERVCTTGACVPDPVPDGLAPTQVAGDCQTQSCVAGELELASDPSDVDDGRSCTADACESDGAVHEPLPEGSECAIGTVLGECSAEGDCLVQCSASSPCPVADPCLSGECVDQICVYTPVSGEPVVPVRDPDGDCRQPACVEGNLGQKADVTDTPPDDGLPCTQSICDGDRPDQENLSAGSACGVDLVCDGEGACTGCTNNTQCGAVVDCTTPTCSATFECTDVYAPLHTPCSTGFCKAGGLCVQCVDTTECPAQTECNFPTCNNDACGVQTVPPGGDCLITTSKVCDASATCVECVISADCPAATACESHICAAGGVCTPVPVLVGGACLVGTGLCNATGMCVECILPTDCTGSDTCCTGNCQPPPCP